MERNLNWLNGALADRRTVGVLLALLVGAAYGASLRNELVFDERIFMERDARVHTLAVGRIFTEALWSTGEPDDHHLHQYFRPLQLLPLALSYAAFGPAAWPSHLLSLLLHYANCLLVLALLRALLPRADIAAALTLLFAVHPGYSEAVLWVSDVAGLGAAFCILAIVRLHLEPDDKIPPAALFQRGVRRLLPPVLLLAGLLFKESGVLAVVLTAGYDLVAAPDRGLRRLWRLRWRYVLFLPPLAIYWALRLHALGGALPGIEAVPLTRAEMGLNAVALLPQFARTFVAPFDLNMYHDFDPIHAVVAARFALGAAMALAWATAFALSLRQRRIAAYGLLWTASAVAPHLLIRWPQLNVFAERYLYLPTVGILLALGDTWSRAALAVAARRAVLVAGAFALVLFVVVDVRRTAEWRDELTIYGRTLTQSARAELIRINLAVRLLELKRYDDGIAVLEVLRRVSPDWPEAWYNLGLLYLGTGDTLRATDAFEHAVRSDPRKAAALLNLGYLYDQSGRRDDAVATYLRLVQGAPRYADGWYNLGVVALEAGQVGNARLAAARVGALKPDDAAARALLARANAAVPSPADREATRRRCDAAKQAVDAGRSEDAIWALQAAAWLDEDAPLPHHFLANVYYLSGRLDEAIAAQREAVRRAPDNELYQRNLQALEQAATATTKPAHP